jgi:hypothetical protein
LIEIKRKPLHRRNDCVHAAQREQERVAVRLRLGERARRNDAAGAGPIVNHDPLATLLADHVPIKADHRVGAAASGLPAQDEDRPRWVVLRARAVATQAASNAVTKTISWRTAITEIPPSDRFGFAAFSQPRWHSSKTVLAERLQRLCILAFSGSRLAVIDHAILLLKKSRRPQTEVSRNHLRRIYAASTPARPLFTRRSIKFAAL